MAVLKNPKPTRAGSHRKINNSPNKISYITLSYNCLFFGNLVSQTIIFHSSVKRQFTFILKNRYRTLYLNVTPSIYPICIFRVTYCFILFRRPLISCSNIPVLFGWLVSKSHGPTCTQIKNSKLLPTAELEWFTYWKLGAYSVLSLNLPNSPFRV